VGYKGRVKAISRLVRWWNTFCLSREMKGVGHCYRCSGDTAFDLLVKYENFVVGFPGFMFRRRDWHERCGVDESFPIAADYDLLCWLCSRGDAAFLPETHFLRREHDKNITHSEVQRLTDVIRILTRYISPDEMAARKDYRRALASKVVRLAQFLTLCGHVSQGRRLLASYDEIRGQPADVMQRPLRRLQFAHIKLFEWILAFSNLRHVTDEQAQAVVDSIKSLIAEHRAAALPSESFRGAKSHPQGNQISMSAK